MLVTPILNRSRTVLNPSGRLQPEATLSRNSKRLSSLIGIVLKTISLFYILSRLQHHPPRRHLGIDVSFGLGAVRDADRNPPS